MTILQHDGQDGNWKYYDGPMGEDKEDGLEKSTELDGNVEINDILSSITGHPHITTKIPDG